MTKAEAMLEFELLTKNYYGPLSGEALSLAIKAGIIEGGLESAVNGASVDLHLAKDFLVEADGSHNDNEFVRLTPGHRNGPTMTRHEVENHIELLPGDFCLASTREKLNLPSNIVAKASWLKSTSARFGLEHLHAGLCDPGFSGHVTLEFKNMLQSHTILLMPGDAVTQLELVKVMDAGKYAYNKKPGSKYMNQTGTTQGRDLGKGTNQ